MKNLIIPERFKSVDYERDVPDLIKKYVSNIKKSRKGLYLWGKSGTGKTHVGYAICKKQYELGFRVLAFKAIDILRMIKEDMNFDGNKSDFNYNGDDYFRIPSIHDSHINFLDGLNNKFKGLVFIDDLGTEKGTEWSLETFYSIIDKKYEDLIPIIITGNLSLDQLGEKMGDRIASRIAQMCDVFEMGGEDKRLNQNMNIQNNETNK